MEERREEATYQERRGPAVDTLDDSQLFFVDKVSLQSCSWCLQIQGLSHVMTLCTPWNLCTRCIKSCLQDADRNAAGQRKPRKRGGSSNGPKLQLRSQAILQQAHKAKPVLHYKPPRKINNAAAMRNKKGKGEAAKCRTKFAAIPGKKNALRVGFQQFAKGMEAISAKSDSMSNSLWL